MIPDRIRLIAFRLAGGRPESALYQIAKQETLKSEGQRTQAFHELREHLTRITKILKVNPRSAAHVDEPKRITDLARFLKGMAVA